MRKFTEKEKEQLRELGNYYTENNGNMGGSKFVEETGIKPNYLPIVLLLDAVTNYGWEARGERI